MHVFGLTLKYGFKYNFLPLFKSHIKTNNGTNQQCHFVAVFVLKKCLPFHSILENLGLTTFVIPIFTVFELLTEPFLNRSGRPTETSILIELYMKTYADPVEVWRLNSLVKKKSNIANEWLYNISKINTKLTLTRFIKALEISIKV